MGTPLHPLSSVFHDHIIIIMSVHLCVAVSGQGDIKGRDGCVGDSWWHEVRYV